MASAGSGLAYAFFLAFLVLAELICPLLKVVADEDSRYDANRSTNPSEYSADNNALRSNCRSRGEVHFDSRVVRRQHTNCQVNPYGGYEDSPVSI